MIHLYFRFWWTPSGGIWRYSAPDVPPRGAFPVRRPKGRAASPAAVRRVQCRGPPHRAG